MAAVSFLQGSVFPSDGLTWSANSIAPTAIGIDFDASKSAAAQGEVQQKTDSQEITLCHHLQPLSSKVPCCRDFVDLLEGIPSLFIR